MTTSSDQFPDDPRPDSSLADRVASVSEQDAGRIRLGCYSCDRNDFDGVDELPGDWDDIVPVQSWEEAIRPVESDSDDGRSALDWQTHLGTCPDCQAEEDAIRMSATDPPKPDAAAKAEEQKF